MRSGRVRFLGGVCLQDQIPNSILSRGVDNRAQEREATALTVDGVLAGREGDVATGVASAFPNRKTDQPQALEWAIGKMQFRIGQLARWVALVVGGNLYEH